MSETLLPPVRNFVDRLRGYFAGGMEETALWRRAAEDLNRLLDDPSLKAHCKSWPDTKEGNGPPSNLLFYEDPDYGFVLNALVKKPLAETNVHDHGKSWTLYGVLEGGEHIRRWRRTDGGTGEDAPATLEEEAALDVAPGYIDMVPPWQIHQEINGNHRTIGFIVRSQRSGTFDQYRYNLTDGSVTGYNGPAQIPFALD